MGLVQERLFDPGPATAPSNLSSTQFEGKYGPTPPSQRTSDREWHSEAIKNSAADFRQVQSVVSQRQPAVAMNPTAAKSMLDDGQFKSQYDTGRSGGTYDPWMRAGHERKTHGYPESDPEDWPHHPIYGFMRSGTNTEPGAQEGPRVQGHYGRVVMNLKESVLPHTTVTQDDSLGSHLTAESVHDVIEGNVDPVSFSGPKSVHSVGHREYIEAQYHKPMYIDDISRIDTYPTHGGPRDQELTDVAHRAEDYGVPYRMHESLGHTSQGSMVHQVTGPDPDHYAPPAGGSSRPRSGVEQAANINNTWAMYNDAYEGGQEHYRVIESYAGYGAAPTQHRPLRGAKGAWEPTSMDEVTANVPAGSKEGHRKGIDTGPMYGDTGHWRKLAGRA